jgi:hypothetical protein
MPFMARCFEVARIRDRRGCGVLRPAWLVAAMVALSATAAVEPGDGALALIDTNAPVRALGKGAYEIGEVRLDETRRTVSFPAVVNLDEGLLEYALVSEGGKIHESLLVTRVEPYQIHLAATLLGIGRASGNRIAGLAGAAAAKPPASPGSRETGPAPGAGEPLLGKDGADASAAAGTLAEALPGSPVSIEVEWDADGAKRRVPLERWVLDLRTAKAMKSGAWNYTGSQTAEGVFLAQQLRSVIAIVADTSALVDNPRPGRDDDTVWQVHRGEVPAAGTPVRVTFGLAGETEKQP